MNGASAHSEREDPREPVEAPGDPTAWSPPLPAAPGFDHRVVQTAGLRTHVATIGPENGDPVLLLHGFPLHWWQWREVAPRLAAAGYRVICPDLRGCGWTEDDGRRYDREIFLRDLVALLDVCELDRPRVVAHDLGAIPTWQLSYAHPERVRAAVLLSVPPGFAFGPQLAPAMTHMPKFAFHRRGHSLRWLWNGRYHTRPVPDAVIDRYLAPLQDPAKDAAVTKLYRAVAIPEGMTLAGGAYKCTRLRPPTLFLFGALDEPITEKRIRRLAGDTARYAEHVEFASVDGAKHFMTDDAPERVTALVADFLGRVA
ncbi:hypothetical protein BKD30_05925 [Tersicoccus phoenicis]|uniref:AB hydrolase-1 domain-containing protein n=2 Tax=Tersicoccus phoenicis TaxID=554083 RepID=A0A1R1LDC5_9MICC|nr:hypothetical protein BKD30_05925 [Tersicoccus phoenicis]